ncbi:MAG: bifunctional aldolase/short-chain dehydrogenase, partial [Lentisphaerota bacterium]
GGGNTSVKLKLKNIVGEEAEVIYVKGSGQDLAEIEPEGFADLNLEPLRKLRRLETLSDAQMDEQLKIHRISGNAPDPSVEALLHAFLPPAYVNHTHADSILILTNQSRGEDFVKEALGATVAVVPYAMSGFPLAKAVMEAYEKNPGIDAIVVLHHGIFTFAEDAKTAYDKMIEYVTRAEFYIEERIRDTPLMRPMPNLRLPKNADAFRARCAQVIRGACARTDPDRPPRRLYVDIRTAPDLVEASLSREAEKICRTGVLTPDHVIRTKNTMAFLEDIPEGDDALKRAVAQAVETFKNDYHQYVQHQVKTKGVDRQALDPFPLLFLVAGLGLFALGVTREAACITADIGEHTIRTKLRAFALGTYAPISESHVFDMEYWSPQQKKLDRPFVLPLQGQVALITGGGGAVGFGIADRLLAAGAVAVISDIDQVRLEKARALLAEKYGDSRVEDIVFDVTDYASVEKAFEQVSRRLGGIDIVVPNAGIAHVAKIEDLDPRKFDEVLAVNLKGTFTVIKASVPVFRRQGTGGNIVVISSKNVFDPGAAFGAYSASKAGAHQMAKIAALELAELGVRVNMINPDAVFGDEKVCSRLWELVGPERMKSRGLDAAGLQDYYCQRSLLKVRVLAEHVGNAVVFFASDLTPTTGASLPVDGGNPAAFPR